MTDLKNDQAKGHGHLIDIIAYAASLVLINFLFFILYNFVYGSTFPEIKLSTQKLAGAIALINGCYFVSLLFVRVRLSPNIILADRIVQKSTYLAIIYTSILAASFHIFNIAQIPLRHIVSVCIILIVSLSIWNLTYRYLLKLYRKRGYNYKNIILIGGNHVADETYRELSNIYTGYKIVGYFSDTKNESEIMPNYLGTISPEIIHFMDKNEIDELYYTLSDSNQGLPQLISYCEKNMIRFHLVPDLFQHVKKKLSLQFLETIPILSLRFEPLQHPLNRLAKRAMDVIISIIVIIFILPIVYLVLIPIIKLSSPGPVHFKQKRTGFRGREFTCLKFRSMRPNKEANKISAVKGDPRITRIGAFMRKTSMDELPQFFNVLKGEMSVVGPRPHMLQHTEEYSNLIEKFMVRHLVKPGITGWAQTTGARGETKCVGDMEKRVKKDVWYIENWTLFLDLKIMAKTVVNAFKGEEQAY